MKVSETPRFAAYKCKVLGGKTKYLHLKENDLVAFRFSSAFAMSFEFEVKNRIAAVAKVFGCFFQIGDECLKSRAGIVFVVVVAGSDFLRTNRFFNRDFLVLFFKEKHQNSFRVFLVKI